MLDSSGDDQLHHDRISGVNCGQPESNSMLASRRSCSVSILSLPLLEVGDRLTGKGESVQQDVQRRVEFGGVAYWQGAKVPSGSGRGAHGMFQRAK